MSSKSRLPFPYFLATIVTIFLIIVLVKLTDQQSQYIGSLTSVQQVTINGQPTTNAFINIPLATTDNNFVYVNTLLDLNKNNIWNEYITETGLQQEWVVQNMAIKITPYNINSFSFKLIDKQANTRTDINARTILTKKPLYNWDGRHVSGGVIKNTTINKIYNDEIGELYASGDIQASAGADWNLWREVRESFAAYLDTTTGDIQTLLNNVPDITQNINECALASTANSYIWLAKKYDFTEKLPTQESLLIDALRKPLNWNVNWGVFMRTDYQNGIHKFNKRDDLPIVNYPLGQAYDPGLWEAMTQANFNNRQVTLDIEYQDTNGQRTGGHVVTLVGTKIENGEKFIFLHDPLSPGPQIDVYKMDELNQILNYRYGRTSVVRLGFADGFIHNTDTTITVEPKLINADYTPLVDVTKKLIGVIKIEPSTENLQWSIAYDVSDVYIFSQISGIGKAEVEVYLNFDQSFYFPFIMDRNQNIAVYLHDDDYIYDVDYFAIKGN